MSTLNVSNITDGTTTVGTEYVVNGSAKAWVNFNGTGTIAARDSFNVASLTDHGTGLYQVNLSSSMNNSNYAAIGSYSEDNQNTPTGNRNCARQYNDLTVSSYRLQPCQSASVFVDVEYQYNMAIGDLA